MRHIILNHYGVEFIIVNTINNKIDIHDNSLLYSFLVNPRILQFTTLLVPRKSANTTISV